MFWYRITFFLIIGSLCQADYPDNALLIERKENGLYRMKCVGTTSSDLAWISSDLNVTLPQWSNYTNNARLLNQILTKSSIHYYLPPVLDYRFEDLETYTSAHHNETNLLRNEENLSVINLSIRFRNFAMIFIEVQKKKNCAIVYENDEDAIDFRECYPQPLYNKTTELELPWRHYTVFRGSDNKFYVQKYKKFDPNLEFKSFSLDKLQGISDSLVQWKIHKYTFLGTSSTKGSQTSTIPIGGRFTKSICVSLFMFIKENCEAYVTVDSAQSNQIHPKQKISEPNKWIEIKSSKILAEEVNDLVFYYGVDSKSNATCDLFAISHIQNCTLSERSIIELDDYDNTIRCRSIKAEKIITYKKPTANEFFTKDIRKVGHKNSISCEDFDEETYCQKKVVCTFDGCYCPSGFTGDWCDQECPQGSWGFNCSRFCNHCLENKCFAENGSCIAGCSRKEECQFLVPDFLIRITAILFEFYNVELTWKYPLEQLDSIETFLITVKTNDDQFKRLLLEEKVVNNQSVYKYKVTGLAPSQDYQIYIQPANIYVGNESNSVEITTGPPLATIDGLPRLINYNSSKVGIQIPPMRNVNNASTLFIAISEPVYSGGQSMSIAREDLDILKFLQEQYPSIHQHKIIYRQHVMGDNSDTYINLSNVTMHENPDENFTTFNIIIRNEYKGLQRFALYTVEHEKIIEILRGQHFSPLYLLGLLVTVIPLAVIYIKCFRKKKDPFERNSKCYIYEGSYLMAVLNMNKLDKTNLKAALERLVTNNSSEQILKDEYKTLQVPKSRNCSISKKVDTHPYTIEGWNGPKSYIVVPSESTNPVEFWTLVWQEQCPIIVLLTTTEEILTKKYSRQVSQVDGPKGWHIEVQSTEKRSDYVLECIKISKPGEDRWVRQIRFCSWTRDGLPKNPLNLFRFIKYIKRVRLAPIIIRYGDDRKKADAFILYHSLLHNLDTNINIPNQLDTIRSHYPQFSLNFGQYKLAYFIIDEDINGKETNIPIDVFVRDYEKVYEKNVDDFNYVHDRKYVYDLLYSDFTIPNIDTHFIDGIDEQQQFIATCQPFSNSRSKFWKLIYNYGIETVVVLQNVDEIRGMFWPNNNIPVQLDTIEITKMSSTVQNNVHIFKLKVDNKKQGPFDVTLLYHQNWDSTVVPDDLSTFYNLYELYKFSNTKNSSTVLCCRDGITACGLFITLDLLVEKSKCDNDFDLCWAVLCFKHRHSLFMSDKEQYRAAYDLIKLHIEKNKGEYPQYETMDGVDIEEF